MRGSSDYQPTGGSKHGEKYKYIFIQRVHQLIGMGYAILIPTNFTDAQEEDITGELKRAVESILDCPDSPKWVDSFSIHEEPRIDDPFRKGKKRRRLDIRIDSTVVRPRPRFCIEAKLLGLNHNVSIYLGIDGLLRFLDGRYANKEDFAGMLGYVQKGNCQEWAKMIEAAFLNNKKNTSLMVTSPFQKEEIAQEVPFSYYSEHNRKDLPRIEIYHILLSFN